MKKISILIRILLIKFKAFKNNMHNSPIPSYLKRGVSPLKIRGARGVTIWIYRFFGLTTINIVFVSTLFADLDFNLQTPKAAFNGPLLPPSSYSPSGAESVQVISPQSSQAKPMVQISIDDFDSNPFLNQLGGRQGVWDKDPLDADEGCIDSLIFDELSKVKNKVLRLQYDVESPRAAYNGYWTQLNGSNLTPFRELKFRVRGDAKDGFTKSVKLELKNSRSTSYVYIQGITSQWQEVIIPLKYFKNLEDKSRVDELVIVFEDRIALPQKGTLYFDDFELVGSQDDYDISEKIKQLELQNELDKILKLNDELLLSSLQKQIFQYFLNEADSLTGFIKDRSTPGAPSSIAATGFGLVAYCIAEKHGWLSRVEAYNKVLKIMRKLEDTASHEHGFFYHFLDAKSGLPWADSEVSSIDTAILMAGILTCSQYFYGTEASFIAQRLYNRVEWNWMSANDQGLLYMQWKPSSKFQGSAVWDMSAEEMLLYILAMGSSKYEVPSSAWDQWKREKFNEGNLEFISDPERTLFTSLYSQSFIDFRNKSDSYADYWENSRKAVLANRNFCMRFQDQFKGYGPMGWGLSASDGPQGYKAYGAHRDRHDGTLAPYASIASLPLLPEIVIPTIRNMLKAQGPKIWGRYGPTSAFNVEKNWYSTEYIGIDQGIMLLMMENHSSGFVWNYLMKDPAIQKGMKKAGFSTTLEE